MFIQLMQTNPGVMSALGSRFGAIAQELERMEKLQELEVTLVLMFNFLLTVISEILIFSFSS